MPAYLARHAAPDSVAAAEALPRRYACAVVVPARNEAADGAVGRRLAAAVADRDALCIVVVNGDRNSTPAVRSSNAALLSSLAALGRVRRLTPTTRWVQAAGADWLLIDRSSPGRMLPAGQGVGGARRLGCDVALALWHRGHLERPWVDSTDADATLPADYFADAPPDAVAVCRPFVHRPGGDATLDAATAWYEMSLRYYVAGLSLAGSPWAMHTVGSCISVGMAAYAAVRGVPARAAGEDFYLLAKVAKLGRVDVGTGAPVEIAARASDRVPFGTGPATASLRAALARGETPTVYNPASFATLGRVQAALVSWCTSGADDPAAYTLRTAGPEAGLASALATLRMNEGLSAAMRGASTPAARRRRLYEWFDAFRTLKLIHGLRAAGHAPRPWPEAVALMTGVEASTVEQADAALRAAEPPCAGLGGTAWQHWEHGGIARRAGVLSAGR